MIIRGRKRRLENGEWFRPIEAGLLEPAWSVVYFYIYPEVVAGFGRLSDALRFVDGKASILSDPGTWAIIQTGEED